VLLSADDLLTPGSLARATSVMEADPDIGFVYGHSRYWREGEPKPVARTEVTGTTVWAGLDWLEIVCKLGISVISSPEVVVRTDIQQKIGGYRPELPHTGDIEMWMRFAVHGDVAFIRGVDQAYYRIHGTNMTTERVPLVDLEQRRAAFDSLFAEHADEIPGAERLQRKVNRALAKDALWRACRAYDRRRMGSTPVDELASFAEATYPDAAHLPEYWGLQWRRRVGPNVCPYLQPIMVSAVHRKVRDKMWWRRWEREGI
jgi:hypothetical protein